MRTSEGERANWEKNGPDTWHGSLEGCINLQVTSSNNSGLLIGRLGKKRLRLSAEVKWIGQRARVMIILIQLFRDAD